MPAEQPEVEEVKKVPLFFKSPFITKDEETEDADAEKGVDILSDRTFLEAFTTFIQSEQSEENLEFLLKVRDLSLKRAATREKPDLKELQNLYDTYIPEGSPRQLSLSAGTQEKSITLFKNATEENSKFEAFENATTATIELLDKDSKARFMQSPAYTEACRLYHLKTELEKLEKLVQDDPKSPDPQVIDRIKNRKSALATKEQADFDALKNKREEIMQAIKNFEKKSKEHKKSKDYKNPVLTETDELNRVKLLRSQLVQNENNFLRKFKMDEEKTKAFEKIKKNEAGQLKSLDRNIKNRESNLLKASTNKRRQLIEKEKKAPAESKPSQSKKWPPITSLFNLEKEKIPSVKNLLKRSSSSENVAPASENKPPETRARKDAISQRHPP